MIKKFLPLLRDLDRAVSRMPKTPRRLEAIKAIGVLLDYLSILQEYEDLTGATAEATRYNAPSRQRGPVKTDTVGAEYVKAGPLSYINSE